MDFYFLFFFKKRYNPIPRFTWVPNGVITWPKFETRVLIQVYSDTQSETWVNSSSCLSPMTPLQVGPGMNQIPHHPGKTPEGKGWDHPQGPQTQPQPQ